MAACAGCSGEAQFFARPAAGLPSVPLCSAACGAVLAVRPAQGKRGGREDEDAPISPAKEARLPGEREAAAVGGALFGAGWGTLPADLRLMILGKALPVLDAVRTPLKVLSTPNAALLWEKLYGDFAAHFGLDPRPPTTDARAALLAVVQLFDYLIYKRGPDGALRQDGFLPLHTRAIGGRNYARAVRLHLEPDRAVLYSAEAFFDSRSEFWDVWQRAAQTSDDFWGRGARRDEGLAALPVREVLRRTKLFERSPDAREPGNYIYDFDEAATPPGSRDAVFARRPAGPWQARDSPVDAPVLNITNHGVYLEPWSIHFDDTAVWLTSSAAPGGPIAQDSIVEPAQRDHFYDLSLLNRDDEALIVNTFSWSKRLLVRSVALSVHHPTGTIPVRKNASQARPRENTQGPAFVAPSSFETEPWYRATYLARRTAEHELEANAGRLSTLVELDLELKVGLVAADFDSLDVRPFAALLEPPRITAAQRVETAANGGVQRVPLTVADPARPAPEPPTGRPMVIRLDQIKLGGPGAAHISRLRPSQRLPSTVERFEPIYVARKTHAPGHAGLGFAYVSNTALVWVPIVEPELAPVLNMAARIVRGETRIAASADQQQRAAVAP